jgi:hypothetical protein
MRVSSLRLLFGHANAYQHRKGNQFVEVPDIFHVVRSRGWKNKYEGTSFQQARFWRSLVTRFWQYDDFRFPGAAAASYMGNAHTFKIWFNPMEVYKLLMTAGMDLYSDAMLENKKKKKGKGKGKKGQDSEYSDEEEAAKRAAEAMKAEQEWNDLIEGKSSREKQLTENYGWSRALYKELEKSVEAGEWTEKGWNLWNQALVESEYIGNNVVSIMVHEMMHILWNHLARNGKRDPYQFNLATDYAINQCLEFTPEIRKVCITKDNETFYGRFVISYARYCILQDPDIRKKVKKKFGLSIDQSVQEFADAAIPQISDLESYFMIEGDYWTRVNKTDKKAADFYYRILEETMIFQGGGEGGNGAHGQESQGEGQGQGQSQGNGIVRGYDGHGQWDEMAEDERGEGDGEGEGSDGDEEGEGSGSGDGEDQKAGPAQQGGQIDQKRGEAKGNSAKKNKGDGQGAPSGVKERGKGEGVGNVHGGWDVTTACSRQEAKSVVRDAMKRSGFDPDDPNDIEKCLDRTPGMESLGAHIHEWFKVRTKNWRDVLKKYVATAVNPQEFDYTMSRENRRVAGMFPGKRRERGIDLVVAIDTSGSINYADYNDFVNQIEKIVRDCDVQKVRMIQCHHSIAFDKMVRLRNIKNIPVVETGGTTMRCVYEQLKRDNNRKLLVLFTDGCIDHFKNEGWGFKSLMFLSRGNECYADAIRDRGFQVLCQDEE